MADQKAQKRLIVQLTASHAVEDFDCGVPARNSWLCTRALGNQTNDDTRTYVSINGQRVSGFYALALASIVRTKLPGMMRRNAPDPVSCILLAQLAVDQTEQGKGLGHDLVLHAMGQAVKIADLGGGRLFTVHPDPTRPDLVAYYKRYGFTLIDTTPALMAMTLKQVRTLLAKVEEALNG